jgi:putative DNA primase/helicase
MTWDNPDWARIAREYSAERAKGPRPFRNGGLAPDLRLVPPPEEGKPLPYIDMSERDAEAPSLRPDGLEHVSAASFKARSIAWMWPGRFAIGKLGLIGGMPDMGKGLISAFIATAVTAGVDLPCGEGKTPQGDVLWFTAEDDVEDTVVPRLIAAGADLSRVHIVKTMRKGGKERTFNLVTDLPDLRKTIERIGNVVLVIIDPMSAYVGVGKVNTSSTTDVRGFLTPLTQMAAELRIAVIGIMHFNKKADVTSAMLRIADSLAYVAAARHVYVVVEDPNVEGRRLFVKAKNNLAPDKAALPYAIGLNTRVGRDEANGTDISAPYIIWGTELVTVTANEAMLAAANGGSSASAKREAVEFLRERLVDGRKVKTTEIEEEAEAHGISKAALKRARRELGAKPWKEPGKMHGDWYLHIPSSPPTRGQEDD